MNREREDAQRKERVERMDIDGLMEMDGLGERLAQLDQGEAAHREAVRRRVAAARTGLESGREPRGRQRWSKGAAAAVATGLLGVTLLAQPSWASSVLDRVIATVTLGHVTVAQMEPAPEHWSKPVPESLQGQLYDKQGAPISVITESTGMLYTKDGEEIAGIADGKVVRASEVEASEANMLIVREVAQLNRYTGFTVGLPADLPEGYAFDRAEFYKDDQGEISPKYVELYFTKAGTDRTIHMQERLADDETAYSMATDGTVEKARVGGADAVIYDSCNIDWEQDGVIYSLMAKGMKEKLGREDLIRIAESVRPAPGQPAAE